MVMVRESGEDKKQRTDSLGPDKTRSSDKHEVKGQFALEVCRVSSAGAD